MLRWSLLALVLIVVLGLAYAFLPERSGAQDRTGVQLRDVNLRLYPAQDPDAEWRFQAPDLSFDPVKGEATITGLKSGERWARPAPDPAHPGLRPLGLDLTMSTAQLTIDASDNIHTKKADIYLIDGCMALGLAANDQQDVLIDQNRGISAPQAVISSAALNGTYNSFPINFDLSGLNTIQNEGTTFASAPNKVCKGGKLVPRTSEVHP